MILITCLHERFDLALSDLVDFNFRKVSTVTQFFTKTFSAFLLISNHFITFYLVKNFCLDLQAGITEFQVSVIVRKDYIRKFYFIAGVTTNSWYIQCLVFFNLELLTGYFNYCEHIGSKIRWAKVRVKILVANNIAIQWSKNIAARCQFRMPLTHFCIFVPL